ncbi:hypothetical protein CPLU01_10914 [Colletotrichum plurivorum]|uniref:Uncharacterized protein n=1 Tax=Colletotrichum plurivorum TaxID=2175906 RepID=A0A8H6N9E1_9PEZI|nr:hypothetical protein CPLU01_10914 [Colletotrichum plurivorum]
MVPEVMSQTIRPDGAARLTDPVILLPFDPLGFPLRQTRRSLSSSAALDRQLVFEAHQVGIFKTVFVGR